jgi:hypothetical protein
MKIQSYKTADSSKGWKENGISYMFQIEKMEDIFAINRKNATGKLGTDYTLNYDMRDDLPSIPLNKVPEWAIRGCFLHIFEGDHDNR